MAAIKVHTICCDHAPDIIPPTCGAHWVDTTTRLTYISVGTVSVDDWILVNSSSSVITGTVNSSSTLDLDITALSSLCAIKYIICLSNDVENKWQSMEMLASKETATSVTDTLYSKIGLNIDVDIVFKVVGTDAVLSFTNNESFNVNIRVNRLIM